MNPQPPELAVGAARRNARRIIVPLIVLAVAGVIALDSSRKENSRQAELQKLVQGICADAAAGIDITPRLNVADPTAAAMIANAIRTASATPSGAGPPASPLTVVITPGDLPNPSMLGTFGGLATHVATLQRSDTILLWLRLQHRGSGVPVRVIGMANPDSQP